MVSKDSVYSSSTIQACLTLPVQGLRIVLFSAVLSLFLAHLITQYLHYFHPIDSSLFRMMVDAFDLNAESNLATWYSASALLVAALLFTVVWLSEKSKGRAFRCHWLGLSVMALAFSADEVACLHEKLNDPIRSFLQVGGFFLFAWVIPGFLFLAFVAVSYRSFYWSLPRSTRRRFALAVVVYFAGSLGLEMVGGKWSELYGRAAFGYGVLTGIEELFEMLGVMLLIDCLARHISTEVKWSLARLEQVDHANQNAA